MKEYVVSNKELDGIVNDDLLVSDYYTVYAISGYHAIAAYVKDNGLKELMVSYEITGVENPCIDTCIISGKSIVFLSTSCIVKQLEFPF